MTEAALPDFEFDATPRAPRCERCGAGDEGDLRFVILRGRTRYYGRTLCDLCTEVVLEVFADDAADRGRLTAAPSTGESQ